MYIIFIYLLNYIFHIIFVLNNRDGKVALSFFLSSFPLFLLLLPPSNRSIFLLFSILSSLNFCHNLDPPHRENYTCKNYFLKHPSRGYYLFYLCFQTLHFNVDYTKG